MEVKYRGGRGLKPNDSCASPRHVIAVDTETFPHPADTTGRVFSHRFRVGCALSSRLSRGKWQPPRETRLNSTDEFWELMLRETRSRQTTWIVAHNALFDFVALDLPKRLDSAELMLDWPRQRRNNATNQTHSKSPYSLAVIDGPPVIIACRVTKTQGRCVFVDTLNWFRLPLSALGEALGLGKLDMPAWTADDEQWFRYCARDTAITYRSFTALVDWTRSQDFGMFRYTVAAQAMSAYRHRLMPHKIYYHDDLDRKSFERRGYYGGRGEVFRVGPIAERVYKLDVSSLFPSVMRSNLFPYTIESYEVRSDYLQFPPPHDLTECVAEVTVKTARPIYPQRIDDRTYYPTGCFNTVLSGPELSAASRAGEIVGYGTWQHYRLAELFTDYVDTLWNLRLAYERDNNRIYAMLCKLMLNSLYGKFGQRAPQWEVDTSVHVPLPWSQWPVVNLATNEHTLYRAFGHTAQKFVGKREKNKTLPAISAWVTSYARLRMNRLREIAGESGVFYQATDSLIVTEAGCRRLLLAGEVDKRTLGKLRHEQTAEAGHIYGVGDYTLDNEHTVAGRPLNAIEDAHGTMIVRKFHTRDQLFHNRPAAEIIQVNSEWHRREGYWRGTVGDNGWVIPPHCTPDTLSSTTGDN